MVDIGKGGGSILNTSLHLYFLKLHSCNDTLPPLIKRRNRGVIFFIFTLFSPLFMARILGPGNLTNCSRTLGLPDHLVWALSYQTKFVFSRGHRTHLGQAMC